MSIMMTIAVMQKGEPMRAIDADALIEKYGDWYTEEGTEEGYIGTIKGIVDSMPTIEPEQKWIPCSERLPNQYGNYLVSIEDGETDIASIDPERSTKWSLCDAYGFYWADSKGVKIIAWMPLPKPYE